MSRLLLTVPVIALVAACGGSSTPKAASIGAAKVDNPDAALKSAVAAYSVDYLGGKSAQAFALLSSRCQTQIGRTTFYPETKAAAKVYGALTPTSVTVDTISKSRATVTYSFTVKTLDQSEQPWVFEGGWRYDQC